MDDDTLDTATAVSNYLATRKPDAQARAGMAVAVGTQPDQEAEYRRLALKAGVPVDTARNVPDEVKRAAALKSVDFNDLAQRFPATTAFLSRVDNAQIAHDDVDGMSLTEGLVNSFKRGIPSLKQNLSGTALRANANVLGQIDRAEKLLKDGRSSLTTEEDPLGVEYMTPEQRAALRTSAIGAAGGNAATIAATQAEKDKLPQPAVVGKVMQAQGVGEAIKAFSEDPLKFIASIGPESLVQNAPALLAAIPAGLAGGVGAAAATTGAGSFATDYGASILEALGKEGVDLKNPEAVKAAAQDQSLMRRVAAQAMAHATIVGAVDAVSGGVASKIALPGRLATNMAKKPLAREIANMGVQMPVQGALGGVGEAGGQIAAGQKLDPGNILAEIVGEAFTAPAEVASIANGAIRERMQQAKHAQENAKVLELLNNAAESSKVRGRDTQSFKAFVESAAENGPVQDVFITPQSLAQSGVDLSKLVEVSPSVAEQVDAATAGGLDIRIPVSEFAAHIAGTDLAQSLIPHLRTEPEGMSLTEAEDFIKNHGDAIRAEVEKALAKRDATDAYRAGRDAVRDNFMRQLVATGRYKEDAAKPVAAAAAAFYTTMAGRTGMTPEEFAAKYPLRIVGEAGAGLSQNTAVPADTNAPGQSGGAQGADSGKSATSKRFSEENRLSNLRMDGPSWERIRAANPALSKVASPDAEITIFRATVGKSIRPDDFVAVSKNTLQTELANVKARDGAAKIINKKVKVRDLLMGNDATEFVYFPANEPSASGTSDVLEQSARGSFNPQSIEIGLSPTADLSTALHEFGHAFLEITADLAARPDAPAEITDDLKTLLDWFGIKAAEGKTQIETWRDMTLDEQRESHEKFARGFEAYLFEGKAPSVELQGVFQRFRAWLLNVYQTLKSLNVTLTDEVRGVMDRMLASEQEIETAEAAQAMAALFRTPEEAQRFGLDWAKYQELGRAQTEQAITELSTRSLKDMQWLTNARSRVLKQLQKDAAEKRRDMRSRVRMEVMAEPVYRAWAFLTGKVAKPMEPTEAEVDYRRELKDHRQRRIEAEEQAGKDERAKLLATQPELKGLQKGQFLAKNKRQIDINVQQRMLEWNRSNPEPEAPPAADGSVPPEEEVGKLDLKAVKAIDKTAAEELQKRRMTRAEGGIDPDVLAEQFGFSSGQQLIKALTLADTPNEAVESLTDQRMLETYGDISSPEALNQAVNEALFNQARQRAVATELKALEKAMAVRGEGKNSDLQRSTVATLPAAAKQFAEAMIAKLTVKDIKPRQYLGAQARAARAAAQALGKDDVATAAKEKRNELVNGYAYRAATDALAEVRDIVAFFRQIQKGTKDAISKTRDVNMVMAMRAIVAQYGVGIGPGERAVDYLENVKAYDPATYEILRERVEAMSLAAAPYSEVSLEKLRGLADELKAMWQQSRRLRQMEVDGKLVDREAVQAELMGRLEEIGIPDRVPGEGQAVTEAERRLSRIKTLQAALRRVESWVGAKDGGKAGPFRKYVWQPVKEAADRYRTEKGKFLKQYRDLLKTVDLGKSRIDAPELGYTFGFSRGGSGKQEILHALLHTGNESNKRKLLLGRGWATENEDGTLDTSRWDKFIQRMQDDGVLGKAEYDFAQGVWDLLEQLKPGAQKTHRDVFGAYFDEVTADSFVTPFGTYRGGYVPAMTDAEVVKDAATRELAESENLSLAYAFPTTSKGFTKARVEYNKPLLLDLRALSQHIDKVLLFTHLEQPVRDVRKLLASGDVSDALHRIDPAAFDGVLTPWLNRAARQQVETPIAGSNGTMRFFSLMRQRAGLAAMFANVSNAAQQITGLSIAAVRVPPKQLLSAAAQFLTEPKKTIAAVTEASDYMASRMDNEIAQMNEAIGDILLNPSTIETAQRWFAKHAYFLQSAVDNVIGPIVWTGAYNEAIQAGETEREAIRRADATVRETQGSTLPEDVSRIETGNAFVRMFTQFAGYFNMQANLLGTEFANSYHQLGLRKGMGRGLYVFVLGFLVPALVSEAIVQAFRGGPEDDDRDGEVIDDWLAALGMGTFKAGVAMIPGVGQAINAGVNTWNKKPYDDRISTSPAIGMIESAVAAPHSVYQAAAGEGSSKKAIRDVATLISLTVGLPATALARPLGYAADVAENRVAPTSAADAARGAVSGVASPESKR